MITKYEVQMNRKCAAIYQYKGLNFDGIIHLIYYFIDMKIDGSIAISKRKLGFWISKTLWYLNIDETFLLTQLMFGSVTLFLIP